MNLKSKNQIQALIGALTLAALSLTAPGCGGRGGGGGFGPDFTQGSGCPRTSFYKLPASCCDSGGNQIRFTDECSATTGSNPPTLGALIAAAAAGQVAAKANSDARRMNSKAVNLMTGGIAKAAIGVDQKNEVGPKRIEAKSPLKPIQETTPNSPTAQGVGSGGASNVGSNFGTGLRMGNVSTVVVAAPNGGEAGMKVAMNDPLVSGWAYSSGGASAAAQAGKGGLGSVGTGKLFGSGSASGLSAADIGAEERIDYNARDTASSAAMNGEDPADYFTRLNLSDSLFKAVERRYRKKAMSWAKSDFDMIKKKQALDPAPIK